MELNVVIKNVTDDQLKDIVYYFNETKINNWTIEYDNVVQEYHKDDSCIIHFTGSFNTSIVDIHNVVLSLSKTYNDAEFIVVECLNTAEADFYMENEDEISPDCFMRTYRYHNGIYNWEFNIKDHPMMRAEEYTVG